jgi:hypothetical protein
MLATLNLIGLGSGNTPNAEYYRWAIGSTVPEDCALYVAHAGTRLSRAPCSFLPAQ